MPTDRVLGDGSLDPAVLVLLVALAVAYVAAARRARRRWPRRRTAAFLAGLGILGVASQSGIETWSERLLSVHMVEHLLIIGPAALLLLAGAPITLALRTLPRRGRAGLVRLLHSRAVRVVAHPLAGLSIFSGVVLATHVPAAYDAALRDPFVHGLEHALYLWAALLFWAPVVAADPLPHRLSPVGNLGYLLAAMLPMSAVGAWLISTDTVAYSPYAAAARRLGVSALADQRAGATIMWLGGTLVLVGATLVAAWTSLVREERRARAREERLPAAVAGGPR
jgi:cytochrome c oxidase assembly factor CtaG